MRPIQMVDLRQQYAQIKDEIDRSIMEVLETAQFIGGPVVNGFSQSLAKYLGVRHVIPCANGTDALQISMMALGLQPGDEVITPSFTYIATTEVIALLGLKPVFVEVDPDTFCLEPEAVAKAITPKTRAIVPVHLYGQSSKMEEILLLASEHNLFVIEDNAQAIGSDYRFRNGQVRKTGTMGTMGCTSFFPSKNLGCYGDGGAICTDDDELAEKLRMIANHGQTSRYSHEVVGCNSRLDALQAAVLQVKLPRLDGYIENRRKAADYYDQAFAGHPNIVTPVRSDYSRHVFHQYTLKIDHTNNPAEVRAGLLAHLAEHKVPAMLYYPVPAHRQKMFAGLGGKVFHLETTDWLTDRVFSLPMHTELDESQLDFITSRVLEYFNKM